MTDMEERTSLLLKTLKHALVEMDELGYSEAAIYLNQSIDRLQHSVSEN